MGEKPNAWYKRQAAEFSGLTVSRTMLERLEKARAVWQGEPLILSGGQSEREKYPEAEVMARWLMEKAGPSAGERSRRWY